MTPTAGQHFPVSFAQQRLWFLEQLAPGSPAYAIPVTLRLSTAVDVAALRRSVNEIVRRHEVLRTRFEMVDGELRQVVQDVSIELPVVDLDQAAGPDEIGRRLAFEAGRRFDLGTGPLIRATLFRLGPHDHLLAVILHHTVADGWSVGVFFDELTEIYPAFVQGLPSPLPELSQQYADYAVWQREQLRGTVLERELAYWRTQLAGLPILPLLRSEGPLHASSPDAAASPAATSPASATTTRSMIIGAATEAQLAALGRDQGATLFMSLLAVFESLLQRATGARDFGVGTVIANRTRVETEGLIGCFVNTLIIRAAIEESDSFQTLLGRVKDTTLDAYSHQELPFERIVEDLRPPREAGRNPLAQVLFSVHNTPPVTRQIDARQDRQDWEVDRGTANFDLTVDLWSTPDGLQSRWQCRPEAASAAQIDQLMARFAALVEAVVDQPHERLADLLPVPGSDRSALLAQGRGPVVAYPQVPVHRLIAEQATEYPDRVAAVSDAGTVSYARMQAQADGVAAALDGRVEPGEIVAICLPSSPGLGAALLGVLAAGAVFLILDPGDPPARRAQLIRLAGTRLVITDAGMSSRFDPNLLTVLDLADLVENHGIEGAVRPSSAATADDPAYLVFTSGSTGAPKGVLISHGALSNHCRAVAERYELGPRDRSIQLAPLGFDVVLEELLPLWTSGGSVCFPAGQGAISLATLTRQLRSEQISVLNIASSYWHEWVDHLERTGQQLPVSLRLVVCGSERAATRKLRRWQRLVGPRVRWMNAYGVAEATITATTCEPPYPLPDDYPAVVPIGWPLANIQAYVLDDAGEPVLAGADGELCLAGAGIGL
ncbi:MAG TPA: condensation domain-containing protein, partial [Propionibacteriaceae bacterium]|nr:condensation domain-containing protein [Propionibacteriaceae bacterium]